MYLIVEDIQRKVGQRTAGGERVLSLRAVSREIGSEVREGWQKISRHQRIWLTVGQLLIDRVVEILGVVLVRPGGWTDEHR